MTTELAGLSFDLPILNAGMGGGVAGADLAAAVSEGGGLGVLGLGGGLPLPFMRQEIRALRSRTPRPFGVNLIIPMLQGGEVRAVVGPVVQSQVQVAGRLPGRVVVLLVH